MSLPISTFSTRANRSGCCSRRATRRSPNSALRAKARSALDLVARESGAARFDELLTEALGRAEIFGAHDDARAYAAALRAPLGLAPGVTVASVEAEMLGGDVGRTATRAMGGGARSRQETRPENCREPSRSRTKTARAKLASRRCSRRCSRMDGEGEPHGGEDGRLTTKGLREKAPALEDDLRREQDRLLPLRERRRAALTLERSAALFVVARSILAAFARMKAERGALDFNDQIARALALVTRSSAGVGAAQARLWARSPAARRSPGRVSAAMGHSCGAERRVFRRRRRARPKNRTVFAVGDEKQSIFAFQGAAPEMFAEMKRAFAKRHRDAERPFADVPLTFSFRSSQTILDAVDMTFRTELAWRGVAAAEEPPPKHDAIRSHLKGVVELWPPIAPSPAPDPEDWRMPLDQPSRGRPSGGSRQADRRSRSRAG